MAVTLLSTDAITPTFRQNHFGETRVGPQNGRREAGGGIRKHRRRGDDDERKIVMRALMYFHYLPLRCDVASHLPTVERGAEKL